MIMAPVLFVAIYALLYFLRWQNLLDTGLLSLGLGIGWLFYLLDATLFAKYYSEAGQPLRPVTRTLWMLLAYWPLAIFVATSTGSVVGIGLVLGLGASLTWDVLRFHRSEVSFKTAFNFPAKSQLNQQEIQIAGMLWCLFFGILAVTKLL